MRILIVDDQKSLRVSLSLMLENAGFETEQAESGQAGLTLLATSHFDLVVTDLRMEGMSGIDLLKAIKNKIPDLPVIVITAYGSIESAVDAMRFGAFDYLVKPFREIDIVEKINASRAFRGASLSPPEAANDSIRSKASSVVANTPQMRALLIKVERVAQTDISVLITGETGTGKTMIARLIHERSTRAVHPFVSVNCASLPEQLLESELFGHTRGSFTGASESRVGLFEEADRGTIFLDEIDTLSPAMQAKLLSVIQDRQLRKIGSNKTKNIDIRIVSASNQDMSDLMARSVFRPDLYFRINGIRLHIPPLRERAEDMRKLVEKFTASYARKYGRKKIKITQQALAYILGYDYPGNVRQLESLVEQMVVFANDDGVVDIAALPEDFLQASHVPLTSAPTPAPDQDINSIADSERMLIEAALKRFPHLSDAARELGIGRTTLWRKIREYGTDKPSPRLRKK